MAGPFASCGKKAALALDSRYAKTICIVASASAPPSVVATSPDKDTESCRVSPWPSASASGIRYGEEGWARVPTRLPLPQIEALERVECAQHRPLAAVERALARAARWALGRSRRHRFNAQARV